MAKTLIGALALASHALAFSNTSPFFLFSTADLLLESSGASIAQSTSITADVLEALKECPTKNYVVVEQEGVSAADYADGRLTPRLAQYMAGQHHDVKSTVSVPDVVGKVDIAEITKYLESKCGSVKSVQLDTPPASKALRSLYMGQQDQFLEDSFNKYADAQDYTVIYITTPPTEAQAKAQVDAEQQHQYEMENNFGDNVQMELKRDTTAHYKRANSTSNEGGLFERYQYFTPGLFMGFAAVIPLFLILLVGIRALTSLEVSYFAFSKEMGPNAQKKQQQ
ncbi:BIG1-domain-containing protein [Didymella exigua CBS 183.55]|uniref:Protein BIG1 n=1 Tax=Didymella exigua CBS 183.55 TaxID=1150837 RepID=A0A6A5RMC8_9PLEO|nr:BIG1-domain-containing protein [Didymella exigua CBS 183.55]KAF1929575.1 BIG1-domain-containing protein [Didymella exigua CBS 183.55]